MQDLLVSWGSSLIALLGVLIPFPSRTARTSRLSGGAATARNITRRPVNRQPSPPAAIKLPTQPLTGAEHFSRVALVIAGAVKSATFAAELQEQARIQLEVVEISIDRLLEEVAEVMTLSPELRARLRPAAVTAASPLRRAA